MWTSTCLTPCRPLVSATTLQFMPLFHIPRTTRPPHPSKASQLLYKPRLSPPNAFDPTERTVKPAAFSLGLGTSCHERGGRGVRDRGRTALCFPGGCPPGLDPLRRHVDVSGAELHTPRRRPPTVPWKTVALPVLCARAQGAGGGGSLLTSPRKRCCVSRSSPWIINRTDVIIYTCTLRTHTHTHTPLVHHAPMSVLRAGEGGCFRTSPPVLRYDSSQFAGPRSQPYAALQ